MIGETIMARSNHNSHFIEATPNSELRGRSLSDLRIWMHTPRNERPSRHRTHAITTSEQYARRIICVGEFCERNGLDLLPIAPETIIQFFEEELDQGMSGAHTLPILTALRSYHLSNGYHLQPTFELEELVRTQLKAHHRLRGYPFNTEEIAQLCEATKLDSSLQAQRDTALILLGFAAALRPSELVNLHREHLRIGKQGMRILIPQSKGDQGADGQSVTIPASWGDLCALKALWAWLESSQTKSGPIFFWLHHGEAIHQRKPLGASRVGALLKRHAYQAGMEPLDAELTRRKIVGHSLRRGCATQMWVNGASLEQIRQHLRHRNLETTEAYIDDRPNNQQLIRSYLQLP